MIGSYTKAVEPVLVKCINCGKEWSPKAYSLLSGKGCPHCGAKRGAKNNKGKTGLKDQKTFISQIGWKSARGNLRETFDVMKHIYSIEDGKFPQISNVVDTAKDFMKIYAD